MDSAFAFAFIIGFPLSVCLLHWLDYRRWNRLQDAIKERDDGSMLRDFWLVERDGDLHLREFDPGDGVKQEFPRLTRTEAEAILKNRRRLASMTREERMYPFKPVNGLWQA